jgi:hypothetical protein
VRCLTGSMRDPDAPTRRGVVRPPRRISPRRRSRVLDQGDGRDVQRAGRSRACRRVRPDGDAATERVPRRARVRHFTDRRRPAAGHRTRGTRGARDPNVCGINCIAKADGFTIERGPCSGPYGYTRFDDRNIRIRADIDPPKPSRPAVRSCPHHSQCVLRGGLRAYSLFDPQRG